MNTIASGLSVMTSSTWLICSGILSGLVGAYWMTLALALAAVLGADPDRLEERVVWFLVKTAIVSPSACAGAAVSGGRAAELRVEKCFS